MLIIASLVERSLGSEQANGLVREDDGDSE